MLYSIFIIIAFTLPQYVHSSCCRLPFTDGECQVNRKGPHRYHVMPDLRSGLVTESTECYINDFDATYRKLVETKNYCNDCPGLLIFHTNSSEIFLFPEYIERILEGRTQAQRKNVVILTTSLTGAYDLNFTLFSRYYSSRRVDEVPSLYVDLQLPEYDPKLEVQPSLRLRIPNYIEDKEGSSKISRQQLISPLIDIEHTMIHQLPYLYHFDIEKHRHPPTRCTLYDVQISSSGLVWKVLDSEAAACRTFMSHFGQNKCFATGFTRLFCPIEESILSDDRLELPSYVQMEAYVERLTIAVTGSRQVAMSLSNDQMRPAKQVKILLLRGYLLVTDINIDLPILVEYGSNCDDYGLVVPDGFSTTRYRHFDSENTPISLRNRAIDAPSCFQVIPNLAQVLLSLSFRKSALLSSTIQSKSDEKQIAIVSDSTESTITLDLNLTNVTNDYQEISKTNYWNIILNKKNLAYAAIVLLVLLILIPLCVIVFCLVYCNDDHEASWTLKHVSHANPPYNTSMDDQSNTSANSNVHKSTQTTDNPIRI
ncbi:unnamed protein product [Rotaria socialis]|uniref:Envelope protein n=1 Tax=Rotaria socialis TaxID=392032 RepID=A0A820Y0F8_9BILA|nr:unnamed protein product [Rotaria socialis]CAF3417455.1 unnamed protein product [Rotaria socialis]CAF4189104.1 unnamed protein product [Rotaria socialis]CAF4539065.1 unnamed protein product [Rotaria socialis]